MSGALPVLAAIALGAVGTLLRAEVTWWSARRTGSTRAGIWTVNVLGAFALGIVVGLVEHGRIGEDAARALGAGLLGGATTFSTWMVLVLRPDAPARRRRPVRDVLVHGLGMLLAGVAAAAVGLWVTGGSG